MSSRIAGNDRLGLGSSKIEVLAKNSKKNHGQSIMFLVFHACGVGFLTSFGSTPPALSKSKFAPRIVLGQTFFGSTQAAVLVKDRIFKIVRMKMTLT